MQFDIPMSSKAPMDTASVMQQMMGGSAPAPAPAPAPAAAPARPMPGGGGVRLKKGQKVALAQGDIPLSEIRVCLGWTVGNIACDLDASAFMLDASRSEEHTSELQSH